MNNGPMIEHDLVDFVGLAKQLTNEQKILATLERIEVLLTPKSAQASPAADKPPQAVAKKPFGRK